VEPVDPSVGGGAEVADAETAGEGGGVEMHDDYGIRVGGAEFGGFGICGWGDRIWVWRDRIWLPRVRFNLLSGFFSITPQVRSVVFCVWVGWGRLSEIGGRWCSFEQVLAWGWGSWVGIWL
jgi:hypothetical protein